MIPLLFCCRFCNRITPPPKTLPDTSQVISFFPTSFHAIDQEKLNKELGTSSLTIPAGTYSFQKEDCPTVSSQLLLITSADQPDEVITGVLKAMTANIDYLLMTVGGDQ